MQFGHAHGFRPQVPELLEAEWPEALDTWIELGAEAVEIPLPVGSAVGMRSRRITYERALRSAARRVPGLTLATGHVRQLIETDGTVRGVVVDGTSVAGDVVVDASGRGLAGTTGAVELDSECGISYVSRTYRLHQHADTRSADRPLLVGRHVRWLLGHRVPS